MAKILSPVRSPPATPGTDFGPRVRAHQRYRAANGSIVPGVTTITGLLAKPQLVIWANRMGLQGIDANKFTDEAAAVGSLAHHLIECELSGSEPDLGDFSRNQFAMARRSFETFLSWRDGHELEPILLEAQLVSERFRFGGTIDCYCRLNGTPTLLDFKTSGAIYDEHRLQVAGYQQLLRENAHPVGAIKILRIGRDGSGIEEHSLAKGKTLLCWRIFKHLLEVYRLRKEMKL